MNTTLDAIVAEYGEEVDKSLITALWAEQAGDPRKCRDIVHMLSGRVVAGERGQSESLVVTESSESFSVGTSSLDSHDRYISGAHSQTAAVGASAEKGERSAITSAEELTKFLVACFPECGADYLAAKVDEIFTSRQDGDDDKSAFQVDPVEAIEIISNAYYNDIEAVEHQKYRRNGQSASESAPADVSSLSMDDIAAKYKVSSGGSKKSKKGKKKGNGSGRARNGDSGGEALSQSPSGNAWNAISKELDSICSIFPMLAVGTVKSAYHESGANVDKAVEKLAGIVESQTQRVGGSKGPVATSRPNVSAATAREREKTAALVVNALRIAFPDEEEALLQEAADGAPDADRAAERLLQLKTVADTPAKKPASTRWRHAPELLRHRIVSVAAETPGGGMELPTARDPLERVPLESLASDARGWVAEHSAADPEYCRRRADALVLRRNELYAKAAKAYSRRSTKGGHSGAAMYYSVEGHKLDARARVWRMRAAQSAVATMQRNGTNIVDLHGLTRAEAVAVALEEANAWYVRAQAANAPPLHVVTGLGRHSVDGKALLHPSVARALRNAGWWIEECSGFIDVLGVCQGGARSA
ncbi:hypothetical protein LPJ72_000951 [Coemansia sp. Benny D160-2]|nr:hypothetical protein LPJ72_000951 [Coemansia sp. Benny D160-2]